MAKEAEKKSDEGVEKNDKRRDAVDDIGGSVAKAKGNNA